MRLLSKKMQDLINTGRETISLTEFEELSWEERQNVLSARTKAAPDQEVVVEVEWRNVQLRLSDLYSFA